MSYKLVVLGELHSYNVPQSTTTADFRMVVQKVNGKWHDVIANGNTVQQE